MLIFVSGKIGHYFWRRVYYEAKFMLMFTKENYSAAKKFNYTRCLIDDFHTSNDDGHLDENNNIAESIHKK